MCGFWPPIFAGWLFCMCSCGFSCTQHRSFWSFVVFLHCVPSFLMCVHCFCGVVIFFIPPGGVLQCCLVGCCGVQPCGFHCFLFSFLPFWG